MSWHLVQGLPCLTHCHLGSDPAPCDPDEDKRTAHVLIYNTDRDYYAWWASYLWFFKCICRSNIHFMPLSWTLMITAWLHWFYLIHRCPMWKPSTSGWRCVFSSCLLHCWSMRPLILFHASTRSSSDWGGSSKSNSGRELWVQHHPLDPPWAVVTCYSLRPSMHKLHDTAACCTPDEEIQTSLTCD